MNSLPNDILRYIAVYLDAKSLYVYLLMSRKILTANTSYVAVLQRLHLITMKDDIKVQVKIDANRHISLPAVNYYSKFPSGISKTFVVIEGIGLRLIYEASWKYGIQGYARTWDNGSNVSWYCSLHDSTSETIMTWNLPVSQVGN